MAESSSYTRSSRRERRALATFDRPHRVGRNEPTAIYADVFGARGRRPMVLWFSTIAVTVEECRCLISIRTPRSRFFTPLLGIAFRSLQNGSIPLGGQDRGNRARHFSESRQGGGVVTHSPHPK